MAHLEFEDAGIRLVRGHLQSLGMRVQWNRVRDATFADNPARFGSCFVFIASDFFLDFFLLVFVLFLERIFVFAVVLNLFIPSEIERRRAEAVTRREYNVKKKRLLWHMVRSCFFMISCFCLFRVPPATARMPT